MRIISSRYFLFCSFLKLHVCFLGLCLSGSGYRQGWLCFAPSFLHDHCSSVCCLLAPSGEIQTGACGASLGWEASLRWMGSIFLHGSVRAMPLWDFMYLQPHQLLCLLQSVPEMPPEVFCDDPNQSVFRNGGLLKIQQEFVLHIVLCISGADLVCSCSANSFFSNLLLDLNEY